MLSAGAAFKVTVYLNRDTGSTSSFLPNDILAFLHRRGIAGATEYRAHAGFGFHRQMHTSDAGGVEGEHLPVIIQFLDTREKISAVLPELLAMVTDGLVEAHPTEILKNIATAERVLA